MPKPLSTLPANGRFLSTDLFTVFTVGHEENYDRGIVEYGAKFQKLGRRKDYPGGFAVRTPEDAERLIDEHGKRGEWAVYALAADWEKDTVPSENGWWNALVKTSRVVRKIPPVNSDIKDQKVSHNTRLILNSLSCRFPYEQISPAD